MSIQTAAVFVASRGWVRYWAPTRPSGQRLFCGRQGLGLLPGARTSIGTASGVAWHRFSCLERIAEFHFKTKMYKRSGLLQVNLTRAAQELLAFVTPKGHVFRWKVKPSGVANAPALF